MKWFVSIVMLLCAGAEFSFWVRFHEPTGLLLAGFTVGWGLGYLVFVKEVS